MSLKLNFLKEVIYQPSFAMKKIMLGGVPTGPRTGGRPGLPEDARAAGGGVFSFHIWHLLLSKRDVSSRLLIDLDKCHCILFDLIQTETSLGTADRL